MAIIDGTKTYTHTPSENISTLHESLHLKASFAFWRFGKLMFNNVFSSERLSGTRQSVFGQSYDCIRVGR